MNSPQESVRKLREIKELGRGIVKLKKAHSISETVTEFLKEIKEDFPLGELLLFDNDELVN